MTDASTTTTMRRFASQRAVGHWLLVCCAMVFAMVVIGGITRLTGSGLSIVAWEPLSGILPPLSDASWRGYFAAYQQTPEYQEVNAGMTLAQFQAIFWWEYVHRLWGRLIGVAFAAPLIWFLVRGAVDRPLLAKLAGLLVLGAAQGALGWYMVASGLVDVPAVSQYRLTAHLALALAIYAAMLWIALGLIRPAAAGRRPAGVTDRHEPRLRGLTTALVTAVGVTILSGGLMAGTDAGFTYNTFPLIDGAVVPGTYLAQSPWYANPFENIAAIQFNHRWLALASLALAVATWWQSRWVMLLPRTRRAAQAVALAAAAQVALGIATLVLVVPVPLAALHQAGAVALLTAALWLAFELRPQRMIELRAGGT